MISTSVTGVITMIVKLWTSIFKGVLQRIKGFRNCKEAPLAWYEWITMDEIDAEPPLINRSCTQRNRLGIFSSFSMKCWRAQYFNFSTWAELWKIEYLRGSSFCNIANNKLKKVKLYHLSENQILNKLYFVKFEGWKTANFTWLQMIESRVYFHMFILISRSCSHTISKLPFVRYIITSIPANDIMHG